jgi:YidC/Oxa1 family membrane protein insertase
LPEFKNPNQQGGGDNRSLLVMMLVLVSVFFGLQYFRAKTNPQTASPNSAAAPQSAATSGAQPAAQPTAPASVSTPTAGSAAATGPTVQASSESTTTLENELYRITFTNRGGQVTSWILKKFKDNDGKKPLDLVHSEAAEKFGYPLSLYTYDAALTAGLNKALYVPSATGTLTAPATLTFNYSDGTTQVRKTFSFDENYVLHADVEVKRNGAPISAFVSWPGGFGDQDNASAYKRSVRHARNGKDEHLLRRKSRARTQWAVRLGR